MALGAAMTPGDHRVVVQSGVEAARAVFTLSPPEPIVVPPFHARRLADRWRIDWMTPGGGEQTTFVLD